MNVTKDVINDLYPLYAEKECSADTRTLVEGYLLGHPEHAAELRQAQTAPWPRAMPAARDLDEADSLRAARRVVRRRSWVLAFAIFFSLAPCSFLHTAGKTYWLFREAPGAALGYGVLAAACWSIYAVMQRRP